MVRRSADGANFDFEPMPQSLSLDYAKFLAKFKTAMLKQFPTAKLVVATSAGAPYTLIDGIEPIVDQMLVMTYNYRWSGSTMTGAIAPLDNTTRTVKLHIARYLKHVPPSKVIMGVPYYGYDWPVTSDDPNATVNKPVVQVGRRLERVLQLGPQVPGRAPRRRPPRGHGRGQRLLHLLGQPPPDLPPGLLRGRVQRRRQVRLRDRDRAGRGRHLDPRQRPRLPGDERRPAGEVLRPDPPGDRRARGHQGHPVGRARSGSATSSGSKNTATCPSEARSSGGSTTRRAG